MKPIYRPMLAIVLFASGTLTGLALAGRAPGLRPAAAAPAAGSATPAPGATSAEGTTKVTFDNPRVTVKEITLTPGASRPSRTRETDEVVLFYAESHYQAVTPQGKTEPRDRQPGTVVWHKKGEVAPTLINPFKKPVHYFSISIK
jgi:hypothetical protein